MVETANEGIWMIDLHSRTIFANDRMAKLLGTTPEAMMGQPVPEFCFPEDIARARSVIAANFEGRSEEFEFRFRRPDGSEIPVLAGTAPLRDEKGRIIGSLGMFSDLTARKATEQRELLLAREVDHRAKNLLAVVQSIVTLTPVGDAGELKSSVVGRIQALARAHSLLSDSRWEGVDLGTLVQEELAPYASPGNPRLRTDGPSLQLRPAAAQSLALVLHELATNAAKYGALSVDSGELQVQWRRHQDDTGTWLIIEWTESGGPPVTAPDSLSFGSSIIRASVDRQLRGKVTKDWRPDGLFCTLRIPSPEAVPSPES